jgi:hypothetical protein
VLDGCQQPGSARAFGACASSSDAPQADGLPALCVLLALHLSAPSLMVVLPIPAPHRTAPHHTAPHLATPHHTTPPRLSDAVKPISDQLAEAREDLVAIKDVWDCAQVTKGSGSVGGRAARFIHGWLAGRGDWQATEVHGRPQLRAPPQV